MQDEVADDVVLPLEQEGDARGHEVPDEDLVVVERAGVVGVAGGDGAHGAAAVAHHRLPEEPPRLLLQVTRRAPPPLRCVVWLACGGAVEVSPVSVDGGGLEGGVMVVRSRVAAGMQRAGGARRAPPPPALPPRMGSESESDPDPEGGGPRGRRAGAPEMQPQRGGGLCDPHALLRESSRVESSRKSETTGIDWLCVGHEGDANKAFEWAKRRLGS